MNNHTPKQDSKSTGSDVPTVQFDNIPNELKALRQWVLWKKEIRGANTTKVPYQVTNRYAASNEPRTWNTLEAVMVRYRAGGYNGIGLAFGGEVVGVDLDGCFNADHTLAPWAADILEASIPTYNEVSPSGNGLHLIYFGALPEGLIGKRFDLAPHAGAEFYCFPSNRYFTVTGQQWSSMSTVTTIEPVDLAPVLAVIDGLFPKKKPQGGETPISGSIDLLKTRSIDPVSQRADDDIICIATDARNGRKFLNLMKGSTAGFQSASHADAALCAILAYYTQDAAQIDRIFKRSGLYRDKWNEKHYSGGATYGAVTVAKAVTGNWRTR